MKSLSKTIGLIILSVGFSSSAQKNDICKTDPQKCPLKTGQIEFMGNVNFLSKTEARKIWSDMQSHIKNLDALCELQKKKKAPQVNEWIKKVYQLGDVAGKLHKKHKYSFNRIEIMDEGKKVDLGVTLLDIESILKSEYIKLNNKDKTCSELRKGFTSAYASHYNLQDSVDVTKELSPWAKQVYSSLNCLCP